MKTALFTNFSQEDFVGYYNGKGKKVKAGESLWMQDYMAKHFAKHLVNRELLRTDEDGNLIYKDGEKFVSPKNPEQVPIFMELFNKAYQEEEEDEDSDTDSEEAEIKAMNKNRKVKQQEQTKNEDPTNLLDDTSEDDFEGKPKNDEEDEE